MIKYILLMLLGVTIAVQAEDFTTAPTAQSTYKYKKYTAKEMREFDKKDVRRLYYFLENAYALNTPERAVLVAYFRGAQSALELHTKMQDDFNLRYQTGFQDSVLCLTEEYALSPRVHPHLLLNATIDTYKKARWWSDKNGVYRIMLWMSFNDILRRFACKPYEEIKPFNPVAPDGEWQETRVKPRPALEYTDPKAVPETEYYRTIFTMADYIELRDAPDSLTKRRFDAFLLGAQDGLSRSHGYMRGLLSQNKKYSIKHTLSYDPDLDEDHLTWLCANNGELSTLTSYSDTRKKLFPRILDEMYDIKPEFYQNTGRHIPMLSVIAYDLQDRFKCDNEVGYVTVPDLTDIFGKQYQLKVPGPTNTRW